MSEDISISNEKSLLDRAVIEDVVDEKTGEVLLEKGSLISISDIKKMKNAKIDSIVMPVSDRSVR